jgi:hypothetical protein
MRTSVFVLLAVVVGYFAYNLWFAPEEEGEEQERITLQEPEQPVEPAAEPEPEQTQPAGLSIRGPGSRRPELDFDGGDVDPAPEAEADAPVVDKREQAAWGLFGDLKDARNAGDAAKAKKVESAILGSYAHTDAGRMLSFERGKRARQRWKTLGRSKEGLLAAHEARRYLTPVLFMKERAGPQQQEQLRDWLRRLTDAVLFGSGAVDGVVHTYKTKPGDALSVLCKKVFPEKFGVRAETGLIMKMNGLGRPQDLKAGVYIRVPAGIPSIVVVKREFRAYFLLDGVYVGDWPVGLGAQGSTPVGSFMIVSKIKNPDWFPKQGVKIKFGDPRNILGTRWMGFKNAPGVTGYGIHGTAHPDSIGKEESSGCIRMDRGDVEELFGWTPRKTKVVIRP